MARKFTRAKWDRELKSTRGLAEREISADAIAGDLRTQNNTLSFWHCGNGLNTDIEDAASAIAAASERLDKLDIVWLAIDEFHDDGHDIQNKVGRTPVADLAGNHVDLRGLDYFRLGKVAKRVDSAIESQRCRRLTKATVKRILISAIKQGSVTLNECSENLRAEFEPYLGMQTESREPSSSG